MFRICCTTCSCSYRPGTRTHTLKWSVKSETNAGRRERYFQTRRRRCRCRQAPLSTDNNRWRASIPGKWRRRRRRRQGCESKDFHADLSKQTEPNRRPERQQLCRERESSRVCDLCSGTSTLPRPSVSQCLEMTA